MGKGRNDSDEVRKKKSESVKNIPKTEEHKRKISEAFKGIPLKEETKQKLRNKIWVTDGNVDKFINIEEILENFYRGRIATSK